MLTTERRYDIDWIRVIAIGLLIIYHVAIGFQPWGVLIGFITSSEPLESIWIPMSLLNVWRIPLLFFVSGMGVCFAIRRRNFKELILERAKRILIPFMFGMMVIVPMHVFLIQHYYQQDPDYYSLNPGHLWFLGNIFIYVLVLSPIFFYLKKHQGGKLQKAMNKLFGNPLILLVIMVPFVAEVMIIKPMAFEVYAMTNHGFVLGLIAFLVGFCCVYSGEAFWQMVKRWKWLLLFLAFAMYLVRLLHFELQFVPMYLLSIESNLWIFGVFGLGYTYLNRPGKALTYLSQAAYPVYILHMFFLYLGSYFLFTTDLPVELNFVLVIVITVVGCFATYELIRRVRVLRLLFGLKLEKKN
jgi:peptidoglycan/LPS O-acetylase OafA/YrhL